MQGGVPQLKSWVILPACPCPRRKVQPALKQDWATGLFHVLWQRTSAFRLPPHTHLVLGPGSSGVRGCRHLLGAPWSTPEPCWAFGQGAGSSLLTTLDFLSGHTDDRKRLHRTGFSQCLSGEREGGRNTGFRHLPASPGTVPSCCKDGWWSSELSPYWHRETDKPGWGGF